MRITLSVYLEKADKQDGDLRLDYLRIDEELLLDKLRPLLEGQTFDLQDPEVRCVVTDVELTPINEAVGDLEDATSSLGLGDRFGEENARSSIRHAIYLLEG